MLFNPIIYLALAVLSLALGLVALTNTDNIWVMLPFFVFIVLFCISLIRPVTEKSGIQPQPRFKPQSQLRKLTAGSLRAFGAGERSDTPAYRT